MSTDSHGTSHRAILYAFLANLGIALAKGGAALYTGSGSMLAEAIHSLADCGNQLLLFVGLRSARLPPDAEHPLGYGKSTYFWSFIVALMLFSMGGLFSIYEGWHKLHAGTELNQAWVALLVLGISIILEGFSLAGALREIRQLRGGRGFWQWFSTTRNAELVVVLGEDTAAILGLLLALVFVGVSAYSSAPVYDALGSICIGVVLVLTSIFIGWRIKLLLLGRSAEPELVALINEVIAADESIDCVLNTITMQFGPDVMLAAKIRMKSGLSIDAAVVRLNALEVEIKRRAPAVKWSFIEPDAVP